MLEVSSEVLHSFFKVLSLSFNAFTLQEIYPPKLSEFAYVTDGACQESEILDKELIILTVSIFPYCTPLASCNCFQSFIL